MTGNPFQAGEPDQGEETIRCLFESRQIDRNVERDRAAHLRGLYVLPSGTTTTNVAPEMTRRRAKASVKASSRSQTTKVTASPLTTVQSYDSALSSGGRHKTSGGARRCARSHA